FTEEIQKQLSVTQDEAEAYKVGGSYDEHGVVPQEVERIMSGVAEVMAGEFQRSLDFFLATTADTDVSKICLSGGTAKVTALHGAIKRRSRLNVEVVDAWRRVAIDPRMDAGYLAAHSPEALVGLGLALRAPVMLFVPGGSVVALLVVFFAFQRPLMSERDDLDVKNENLTTENNTLK